MVSKKKVWERVQTRSQSFHLGQEILKDGFKDPNFFKVFIQDKEGMMEGVKMAMSQNAAHKYLQP